MTMACQCPTTHLNEARCDTGTGSDHGAHSFRSTAATLFNEEGAIDGDVSG